MKKAVILTICMLLLFAAAPAFANSALPPTVEVFTEDAPEELELIVTMPGIDEEYTAKRSRNTWAFYYFDAGEASASLIVRMPEGERTFKLTDELYKCGAKLSFASGEPELSVMPFHEWPAVIRNVLITLALELIVLLLFFYKKGRTYLIVLIANLVTQAGYNFLLFSPAVTFTVSLDIVLIAEAVIILIEGFTYFLSFREHGKVRAWIYAVVANLVSMLLGTYLALILNAIMK